MADETDHNLTALTADVVSAYVGHNKIGSDELGKLIAATHQALWAAGRPATAGEPETLKADKAAIRKSIHPDHLVSFIDGRRYKSLKRHLSSKGLTAHDYRERYGLPTDYPMVAPSYSAKRSELARSLGLGRKAASPEPSAGDKKPAAPGAKGRSRGKAIKPEDETFS